MAESFTHLHVHTEFSMLDGAARVGELVAKAAADGQPAVGITDHGNMYGVLDFYQACRDQGVKPIIGSELYMAYESRTERPPRRGRMDDSGGDAEGGRKAYYHLTALAESNVGYKNLIQLSSRAYLEGYYMKPKVDWELLEAHHEGIIATTGCLGGQVLQALLKGDPADALAKAARLQDIFGRDNLFIELQDHQLPEQKQTNPQLLEIARKIQAPLLATNDSHYTHQEDHEAHDALLCVQTGALMSDPDRFKFTGDQHYLKTADEMRRLFAELPEACDNTLWVAERADVEIEFGNPQLPDFPIPEGYTGAADYLEKLTFAGARERWGDQLPDAAVERLAFELKVIGDMGFSSYFLIVWDLIKHARDADIRVGPGRGSAAGCAVAYCLRITDLDPIKYDLLFERFLNPSRVSMPDIDMDFDSRYRDEMIRYAAERYGRDHVAQIVTFSTIKARAAVRDAARVLGYPYVVGDKVAKAMPPLVMGRDTPLYACLDEHPKFVDGFKMAGELRDMYATDPDAKSVIDVARGLEGLRRQDGIHAAAVVITKEPLTEYLPIQRKPEAGKDPELAPVVTQYEMHGVEELGLLKMDFLGLRNLDVISDTQALVQASHDPDFDIDLVPLDDAKTFELLRAGDSIGVFQLEGGPMRALMRSLAPDSFEDVAALVALYRPGPMAANMHNDYADRKNGRKPVDYLHPDAEEILGSTYGLCLAGDTVVFDALSGRPVRLDDVRPENGFFIQGVDDHFDTAVRPVTHWMCNGERDTVSLKLANGMSLTGTPDHQVLTEFGWRELSTLGPDDFVAVARELVEPVQQGSLTRDELRVLGYLLGDGSLTVKASVCFVNTERDLLDEFTTCVTRAFPGVRCSVSSSAAGVSRITVGNGKGKGGEASSLLMWLRQLGLKASVGDRSGRGGVGSHEKFVPPDVFELANDDIAWFLASLWDCDGHVNDGFATYRTISPRLAADVQLLLLRLGIEAVVYDAPCGDCRGGHAYQVTVFDGPAFSASISPNMALTRKRSTMPQGITKGTSIDRASTVSAIRAVMPGPTRHVASALDMVLQLELADVADSLQLNWVRVAEVVPAGCQLVYDITVDEVHNFIANGIVTHNCIYQESVMRLAQKFAGYTLAEADILRKSTGKKDRVLIAKERAKFEEGCETQGYGRELGKAWFDIIEPFADYAFNKSHSYGYGLVAYQTAFLKANYPVEYFAALLTSVKTNLDKAAVYLNECRQMRVAVLVPDVNVSMSDFVAVAGDGSDGVGGVGSIPFGLSAVRNVGEGLVGLIVSEREASGSFVDFYDFCDRVDLGVLNKRTIESLIKAGAFDSMGHPRQGLLAVHEEILETTVVRRRREAEGQFDLFSMVADDATSASTPETRTVIPAIEFDKKVRLGFEKEMLGLYVSDHPLMGAEASLRRRTECSIAELEGVDDGSMRVVGGLVTSLQRKWTKKGDLMAVFVLEDLQSSIEVMVFPKTMQQFGHLLADDAIVCVKARVDGRDDTPKLMALELRLFEPITDGAPPVRIQLSTNALSEHLLADLKGLLSEHPGESQVFLHLGDRQVLRLPGEFNVDASNGLIAELRVLLGPDAIAA